MSILNEVQELVDGKDYGHYIACICMFHQDSSPSLMIYEDTYTCLSCGAFGKTTNLLRKLKQDSGKIIYTPDKEKKTKNPFNRWLKKQSLSEVLKVAKKGMKFANSRDYLYDRGFNDSTIDSTYLGYLDGWITIPIVSQDRKLLGAIARATKSINSTTRYFIPYGQDPNLIYCPDWSNNENYTYLTFGSLDAISLFQIGLPSLSTTTGKRLDYRALNHIRKKIIIIPDRKEEREAGRLAGKLGWRGETLYLDYPEGCKDINDLLVQSYPIRELLHD